VIILEIIETPCRLCGAPANVTCRDFRGRDQGIAVHQVRRNDALTLKRSRNRAASPGVE
jgi:hypothetical protein